MEQSMESMLLIKFTDIKYLHMGICQKFIENSKLEQFLFRILYGLWLLKIAQGKYISWFIYSIILSVSKIILTQSKWIKYEVILNNRKRELTDLLNNPSDGINIGFATYTLVLCISGYMSPVPLIAFGLTLLLTDNLELGCAIYLILLIVIICFIPNYDSHEIKRRYLKYFNRLKIKTAVNKPSRYMWHSILFCIGAILVFILGILSFFLIATNFQFIDMIINR